MNPSIYLHGLNMAPQFGPTRLGRLFEFFNDWEEAYKADGSVLAMAGIEPDIVDKFINHRQKINLEDEAAKLVKENIKIMTIADNNYPELLKQISKYPPIFYYKGQMEIADELCVAVVGTRKITNYGRTVAPYLIEPLLQTGVTIVSGLAYGVDGQMQQLAIQNHKRTIAVLGGGLDDKCLYPKQHALLAQEILDNGGALISEYPIGTPALKQHFVARNRIISGLSVATVIIECNLKSGSLITAKYALEQNRNVYAVPGPIYAEMSQGPNNLIKMGAKLITQAGDILDDLNLKSLPEQKQAQSEFGDNPIETQILSLLNFEPVNINDIIRTLGLETGAVTSALTFLEIKGRVKNLGAQQYIKAR